MSEPRQTLEDPGSAARGVRLVRLPVEKPQMAAAFLRARSQGVMDLIAHFWERLSATPPLSRGDLHLVAAVDEDTKDININMDQLNGGRLSGAMLYVPRAHRADVLALDESIAAAFAGYIGRTGRPETTPDPKAPPADARMKTESPKANGLGAPSPNGHADGFQLTDLSGSARGANVALAEVPVAGGAEGASGNGRAAIDFLTGDAQGIRWMTHHLLPLVHRRAPARELVNVVMQLPAQAVAGPDANVRLARETDIPVLNRWRRQYKEERGILFDADMDAWVDHQRVFVYEIPVETPAGKGVESGAGMGTGVAAATIVAVAKIDLDLQYLVEIGGVYTFPEFRQHGFGAGIVRDLAHRIRQMNKTPTLQVDERNTLALRLYSGAGWKEMGRLGRVWLTG